MIKIMNDKGKPFRGPTDNSQKKSKSFIKEVVTKRWDMDMIVVDKVHDKINETRKGQPHEGKRKRKGEVKRGNE
jgi:hypothetical protein